MTATERLLARIWAALFSGDAPADAAAAAAGGGSARALGGMSARSHFWELGGTSALAVQMVAQIGIEQQRTSQADFADDAPARHRRLCGLINTPRLREFAAFLDAEAERSRASGPQSSQPVAPGEQKPKKKKKRIRRKRMNLATGLQQHTLRMFHTHSGCMEPKQLGDAAAAAPAAAAPPSSSATAESTEAGVLRLARACGDVLAAATLEMALGEKVPAVTKCEALGFEIRENVIRLCVPGSMRTGSILFLTQSSEYLHCRYINHN